MGRSGKPPATSLNEVGFVPEVLSYGNEMLAAGAYAT